MNQIAVLINFTAICVNIISTEKTAANTFFNNKSGVARSALRRHQFGGSLGGPLSFPNFGDHNAGDPFFQSGKDKLFFFVDTEIRRDRSQSVNYGQCR